MHMTKVTLEGHIWAVNASAEECAQVLHVRGGCSPVMPRPGQLSDAAGNSGEPTKSAGTLPLQGQAAKRGQGDYSPWGLSLLFQQTAALGLQTAQTPHAAGSPPVWESSEELDELSTSPGILL